MHHLNTLGVNRRSINWHLFDALVRFLCQCFAEPHTNSEFLQSMGTNFIEKFMFWKGVYSVLASQWCMCLYDDPQAWLLRPKMVDILSYKLADVSVYRMPSKHSNAFQYSQPCWVTLQHLTLDLKERLQLPCSCQHTDIISLHAVVLDLASKHWWKTWLFECLADTQ